MAAISPNSGLRVQRPPTGHVSAMKMSASTMSDSDVQIVATRLLAYCIAQNWAGYDPYDALNSPLFRLFPFLNHKVPRLVLTQALRRSPVNFRGLLGVPKTQNPKGVALFLAALLKTPQLGTAQLISSLRDTLLALRAPGTPYWCWGYNFPWQTRTLVVPVGTPNLVTSVFVGQSLLDLYDRSADQDCASIAESTANYILKELYWTEGRDCAGVGYPLPSMRHQIHNANFLGSAFLARVYGLTGEVRYLDGALRLARYSASRQRADGSWVYGEETTQQWVDNFHTGFNLCALHQIDQLLATDEFEAHIRHGFDFYRDHFFREDGAPRYYHNKTYPIDIHCVAQSIITLLTLPELRPDNSVVARTVFEWSRKHMWNERGFFSYRVLRGCTIHIPYMRWSQAWMLLALSTLLQQSEHRDAIEKFQRLSEPAISEEPTR